MNSPDVLVVGAGCTGVMAARTLAEAGLSVLVLDGGVRDEKYSALQPPHDFIALRKNDEQQYRYFLGDAFESVPQGNIGTGAQLTPARRYLIEHTARLLPLLSTTFAPIESLAEGGLGGGWGLGCCVFSDAELQAAGLPVAEMHHAAQTVCSRIGISATADDAQPYTFAHLTGTQPSVPPDALAQKLLHKYSIQRNALRKNGFALGRPALALLTQNKDQRSATSLRDMEFYDNLGHSAWRPQVEIAQLRKLPGLQIESGWMVTRFTHTHDAVHTEAIHIHSGQTKTFTSKRLVLSPGVLGTARIVLRSLPGGKNEKLPLLCNPYTYMPCIVPSMLGKSMNERNIAYAQLSLFHDADGLQHNVAMASLYTYRSLLLFRLLRETPLNFRDGRIIQQYLLPALLIAGIHHPETPGSEQWLQLAPSAQTPTGDVLNANYTRSTEKENAVQQREQLYIKALRRLGAWKLKTVHPGHGSSIHYAGCLPFAETEKAFTLHPSGRLHGTNNVYVADGSGFRFLPAKGLTLSLMANAHRVAQNVIKS
ncbi:MAG: FAD-dependent monooxygenase [Bacteroidia bacterium]|jgi:choline dehydrogenase-like flavoprotein|nr:FAD-dependent monooxygenase [Bacteroidia bacterium]